MIFGPFRDFFLYLSQSSDSISFLFVIVIFVGILSAVKFTYETGYRWITLVIKGLARNIEQRDGLLRSDDSQSYKSIRELSVLEVCAMLDHLGMGEYKDTIYRNSIDGHCLSMCCSVDEVKEWGINLTSKAKVLYKEILSLRVSGVPLQYLKNFPNSGHGRC